MDLINQILAETSTHEQWEVAYYHSTEMPHTALAVWDSRVLDHEQGEPICLISPVDKVNKRDLINAHLIAASPMMLKALLAVYEKIKDDHSPLELTQEERGLIKGALLLIDPNL